MFLAIWPLLITKAVKQQPQPDFSWRTYSVHAIGNAGKESFGGGG